MISLALAASFALGLGHPMSGTGRWALGTGCVPAPVPSAECPVPDPPAAAGQPEGRPSFQIAAEVIVDVRVHGNHVTSDEDVAKIAAVALGSPFTATTVAEVTARLKASKKFDDVTVLKRFASIEDASKIVLVIVVNEGPVRLDIPKDPTGPIRVVRRRGLRNVMFMPIFSGEDGYGATYGVRFAYVGAAGKQSRVSFPLTWGGTKQAGMEFERSFTSGPLTRVEVGSAIQRQKNPAYVLNDDRRRLWVKAERAMGKVRIAANTGAQWVSFGGVDDAFRSVGGSIAFDTRLDPVMPRNAVFATASVDRLFFGAGAATNRTRLDGRGYIAFIRQTVIVVRAVRESSSGPLPDYLRSLLGGWSSLRGFKAGSYTGDTLVAGSVELRIPLNSPVSFGKVGVSAFVDGGTAYNHGERLGDQVGHVGIGGSGWLTVAAFRLGVSVAHGIGSGTRVNFGAALSF